MDSKQSFQTILRARLEKPMTEPVSTSSAHVSTRATKITTAEWLIALFPMKTGSEKVIWSRTAYAEHSSASRTPQVPPPSAEPTIHREELTPEQLQNLIELEKLGAQGLDKTFTATHLKSEFRRLAKALHPDHHESDSAPAKARWTQRFRHLRAVYKKLEKSL